MTHFPFTNCRSSSQLEIKKKKKRYLQLQLPVQMKRILLALEKLGPFPASHGIAVELSNPLSSRLNSRKWKIPVGNTSKSFRKKDFGSILLLLLFFLLLIGQREMMRTVVLSYSLIKSCSVSSFR